MSDADRFYWLSRSERQKYKDLYQSVVIDHSYPVSDEMRADARRYLVRNGHSDLLDMLGLAGNEGKEINNE